MESEGVCKSTSEYRPPPYLPPMSYTPRHSHHNTSQIEEIVSVCANKCTKFMLHSPRQKSPQKLYLTQLYSGKKCYWQEIPLKKKMLEKHRNFAKHQIRRSLARLNMFRRHHCVQLTFLPKKNIFL